MKNTRRLLLGLLMSILVIVTNASTANDLQRSDSLTSEQSFALLLDQHKGKVIYLDFWASWCGPCRKSFPWMNDVQAKFNAKDFVVISVNLDTERELADTFVNNNPVHFPVVFDPQGDIANRYKLKGMPSSYLIGRDGQVNITHVGFFSKKQHQYEQEIRTLLGENND